MSIPLRMLSTPAVAGVNPPSHAINARHGGRQFPLAKFVTSAAGRCLFPIAIYGEGVADRPGVRSIPPRMPSTPAAAGVNH